jgi:predicted 3-demethylubiquinone-9 3-methyltransferase (glyoxalase superfamily)
MLQGAECSRRAAAACVTTLKEIGEGDVENRPSASSYPRTRRKETPMKKITPFLWFDTQAEEAANLYVSIFKNSKVIKVNRWGEGGPAPAGTVMTVLFELDGQELIALNGGPHFKFTEAFSFSIDCQSQEEIDHYWTKLTANGGAESQCGWLKDRFGLSWQVVPSVLGQLMGDPNPAKAKAVTQALMKMGKIDLPTLKRAHEQA